MSDNLVVTDLHFVECHRVEVLLWHVHTANLAFQAVKGDILLLQIICMCDQPPP